MFNNRFPENRTVYEIMSKNMLGSGMRSMTVRCMCFACWIRRVNPLTHRHTPGRARTHSHTHTRFHVCTLIEGIM